MSFRDTFKVSFCLWVKIKKQTECKLLSSRHSEKLQVTRWRQYVSWKFIVTLFIWYTTHSVKIKAWDNQAAHKSTAEKNTNISNNMHYNFIPQVSTFSRQTRSLIEDVKSSRKMSDDHDPMMNETWVKTLSRNDLQMSPLGDDGLTSAWTHVKLTSYMDYLL